MASTSSINSNSSSANAVPNPPPRSHSRPTQPPPPPPLPSVPPVPPARDSSISISKTAINNKFSPTSPKQSTEPTQANISSMNNTSTITNGTGFLSQFESLFKPISDLPPPELPTRSRTLSSQNVQQK